MNPVALKPTRLFNHKELSEMYSRNSKSRLKRPSSLALLLSAAFAILIQGCAVTETIVSRPIETGPLAYLTGHFASTGSIELRGQSQTLESVLADAGWQNQGQFKQAPHDEVDSTPPLGLLPPVDTATAQPSKKQAKAVVGTTNIGSTELLIGIERAGTTHCTYFPSVLMTRYPEFFAKVLIYPGDTIRAMTLEETMLNTSFNNQNYSVQGDAIAGADRATSIKDFTEDKVVKRGQTATVVLVTRAPSDRLRTESFVLVINEHAVLNSTSEAIGKFPVADGDIYEFTTIPEIPIVASHLFLPLFRSKDQGQATKRQITTNRYVTQTKVDFSPLKPVLCAINPVHWYRSLRSIGHPTFPVDVEVPPETPSLLGDSLSTESQFASPGSSCRPPHLYHHSVR